MKDETRFWLTLAKEDLESAEIIELPHVSVFYCQQSIEKSLKALEIEISGDFERTHDLRHLGKKLNIPNELQENLGKVSRAYITSRYPNQILEFPSKKYNQTDRKEFLRFSNEMIIFIEKKISSGKIKEKTENYSSNQEDILKAFKKRLEKIIQIERLILFGSRSKGINRKDSDYDILVVSDSFKDKSFDERLDIAENQWDYSYPADIICISKDEMIKMSKEISIIGIAIREGIDV